MSQNTCQEPTVELVVMSRPARLNTPGHIMLAVSVAGEGEYAWGFYPDGVKEEFALGIGRYTNSAIISINYAQFRQLTAAIRQHQQTVKYRLLSTNCRDFVMTMLRQIGVIVPPDMLWPNDQGKQFVKMYGESWGRCLTR